MQTTVLTPTFEKQAKAAGLSEDELMEIVTTIASDPLSGALIVGTGGARKVRHVGRGKGKSGVTARFIILGAPTSRFSCWRSMARM